MTVSAQLVKELREKTGAPMMACKEALTETGGDLNRAVEYLRKKGAADLQKKADRVAKEGLIDSYIHGGRIGVLVEVNCETDFVARNDDFRNFVHDLAMQIAAMNPSYITKDDVPESVLQQELEIYKEQARKEGKPENVLEKIAQGKLEKFYSESCLLEQPFVKNTEIKINDYLYDLAAKIGENIKVRRFKRFELGSE